MGWMHAQGFFAPEGFALAPGNVHFAASRAEKLRRIAQLACDVFIDDLAEVLVDPEFPAGVRRILFSGQATADARYEVCGDWRRITESVFGRR